MKLQLSTNQAQYKGKKINHLAYRKHAAVLSPEGFLLFPDEYMKKAWLAAMEYCGFPTKYKGEVHKSDAARITETDINDNLFLGIVLKFLNDYIPEAIETLGVDKYVIDFSNLRYCTSITKITQTLYYININNNIKSNNIDYIILDFECIESITASNIFSYNSIPFYLKNTHNIKTIGSQVFQNSIIKNKSLSFSSLELLDGTYIFESARIYCIKDLGKITNIPPKIFENSFIEYLYLPETLTELGTNSFYYMYYLKHIYGLEYIKKITGSQIFHCNYLLDSVSFPNLEVCEITAPFFQQCYNLRRIESLGKIKKLPHILVYLCYYNPSDIYKYGGQDVLNEYLATYKGIEYIDIPETLEEFSNYGFLNTCNFNLDTVRIPKSAKTLCSNLFSGTSINNYPYENIIKNVYIPNTVENFTLSGGCLFSGCWITNSIVVELDFPAFYSNSHIFWQYPSGVNSSKMQAVCYNNLIIRISLLLVCNNDYPIFCKNLIVESDYKTTNGIHSWGSCKYYTQNLTIKNPINFTDEYVNLIVSNKYTLPDDMIFDASTNRNIIIGTDTRRANINPNIQKDCLLRVTSGMKIIDHIFNSAYYDVDNDHRTYKIVFDKDIQPLDLMQEGYGSAFSNTKIMDEVFVLPPIKTYLQSSLNHDMHLVNAHTIIVSEGVETIKESACTFIYEHKIDKIIFPSTLKTIESSAFQFKYAEGIDNHVGELIINSEYLTIHQSALMNNWLYAPILSTPIFDKVTFNNIKGFSIASLHVNCDIVFPQTMRYIKFPQCPAFYIFPGCTKVVFPKHYSQRDLNNLQSLSGSQIQWRGMDINAKKCTLKRIENYPAYLLHQGSFDPYIRSSLEYLSLIDDDVYYYKLLYPLDLFNNLKTVILNDSLEQIYPNAFTNCKKLEFIEIKDKILAIANTAFQLCSNLKTVIIRAVNPPVRALEEGSQFVPPSYHKIRKYIHAKECKIYVPDELVETYKNHEDWILNADQIYPLSEFDESILEAL